MVRAVQGKQNECVSDQRELDVPRWQMDEIVQNTCATFVANDDSHTLEEIVQLANILKSSAAQIMEKLRYSRVSMRAVGPVFAYF